ncbi:MAG: thiol reductant ABC exporter subunit CydC [Solirubrobacterales bacterium]|nr:thiol reductant ABC exporter subunit CydC [Solirubrobacterales bacterium]
MTGRGLFRTPAGRAARATRSRWRLVALSCLLGALTVIAATGLLTASGYLISRAAELPPILSLTTVIVLVRFFGISRALLRYLERLASHDLAFRTLTDLRERFFERLVPLVPAGLGGMRRGDLLSRFVGDVDSMQNLYLRALTPPLVAVLAGGISVAVACLILPAAGLVLLAMMLAGGILAPAVTRAAARRAGRRQAEARGALSTSLLEVITGSAEIAAAGRREDWLQRTVDDDHRMLRLQRADAVSTGLAEGLITFCAVAAVVAVTWITVPAVADGALRGVWIAALALLTMGAFEAITPLGPAAAGIDAVNAAAGRIEEITEHPNPVPEPEDPRPAPDDGPIRLEQVGFTYEPGRPVLTGIDLELWPGEAVALTGPSGEGKSTIGELMVRLRDVTAGAVTLGGIDLRELSERELRDRVRLGPQESYLFTTTIRRNVEVGRHEATLEEVEAVVDAVGLGDWTRSLPDGLDTFVGEGGAQVSGGQRQRIAAARLFLSKARFLILDEPMAHLDPDSAAALEARITAHARTGPGVLVITHTVTDPTNFDRILELRGGRLTG